MKTALMRQFRSALALALVVTYLSVTACGGGGSEGAAGGTDTSPSTVQNASPGGIWKGTDSITGLSIYGIVTERGEFRFLRSDGSQYFGSVTTSGNNLSGSFDGILQTGMLYADGSNHGTGTISGTIEARQTITATTSYTTANGTATSGTINLTFDALYDSGSSLSTVAGTYYDAATNTDITVSNTGAVSNQDPSTGCVLSGQISIINNQYDAYGVQYSFTGCQGSSAFLNNTSATGLAVFDTTANPAVAYIGVVNTGADYVLTEEFPLLSYASSSSSSSSSGSSSGGSSSSSSSGSGAYSSSSSSSSSGSSSSGSSSSSGGTASSGSSASSSSSGSNSSSSGSGANQAIGGMWTTSTQLTASSNASTSMMLTTETGEMSYNGVPVGTGNYGVLYGLGTLSVEGNVVTGPPMLSVSLFSGDECPWSVCGAGTANSFGEFSGSISQRDTMTLDGIVWTYNQLYNQPSSLAAIAGTWSQPYIFGPDGGAGEVLIDSTGGISVEDTFAYDGSGCAIHGQVSLIDRSYNAYDFTMTYSNCTGGFASEINNLNGSGIGYIDTTTSPITLWMTILYPNPAGIPYLGLYRLTKQ